MSGFQLARVARFGRLAAVAICIASLLVGSVGTTVAGASLAQGDAAPAATQAKKKKKKKCKKGYKRVTVKVKRKRGKKIVIVKIKKCRKAKKKAKPALPPAPSPKPVPAPGPTPTPSAPRISQILGWSTVGQDPDTPPADLVADGGTISTCPVTNSLSVYVRRSGFTSVGLVSHVWKRDGAIVASGTNSNTYEGAFRYGLSISPQNGVYEITWSSGGSTIATAKITRSC
jgi:hypothetical protein